MKAKKKNGKSTRDFLATVGLKNRNFLAVLLGLTLIYIVSYLLLFLMFAIQQYIDFKVYDGDWSRFVFETDLRKLQVKNIQNLLGFMGSLGLVRGIVSMLIILVFAFSGWFILKLAKTKLWFLPAIPVLFIALFSFQLTSSGNYSYFSIPFTNFFGDPVKPFFIAICLLAALFGGWVYKHVSVHK